MDSGEPHPGGCEKRWKKGGPPLLHPLSVPGEDQAVRTLPDGGAPHGNPYRGGGLSAPMSTLRDLPKPGITHQDLEKRT